MPLLTAGPSRFLGGSAAPWWQVAGATCVAAYQPKGAADLATSYVNLANPGTYNAAPGVAPTLVASGWVFNGITQWLTSGVLSAANMSVFVRFSNATGATKCAIGSQDVNSHGILLLPRNGGQTGHFLCYGATSQQPAPALSSGVLAVAGVNGYLDGVSQTSALGNVIANPKTIYIGAMNNNGGVAWHFIGNIQAAVIYSTVLTAGDVAALTARMQAL